MPSALSIVPKPCPECGGALPAPKSVRGRPAKFCSQSCAKDFHNRLAIRGAQLVTLYMAFKWGRREAVPAKVQRAMDRLISRWRDEDFRERGGRESWGDWKAILASDPTLTIDFIHTDKNGWSEGRKVG